MSVHEIFNFITIDDRIATAGQPTEDQLRQANAAGFEAIVNLAPDGLETSLADEAGLVGALGLAYHHIPVPWTEPRMEHLHAFTATMDSLAGQRVLIHCQANFRVTVFFSLYAMARMGWDQDRADALIDRAWSSRPGYRMDETWQAFLAEARSQLGG